MKRLIVTGDDFGLAKPVNEGIEKAHRNGILTTASLMVGAAASFDAVERARNLGSLRVGLHVVVVEGRPILPPSVVPDIVNSAGEFSDALVLAGFSFFFRPRVRRQLESEIRAQFETFHKTGLKLDHVNAHNHMHLHPTVLSILLKVGRDYGLSSARLPYEPPLRSWKASRRALAEKLAWMVFLYPWLRLMRVRMRTAGIRFNDFVFGMADSGSMDTELVIKFLRRLPNGVTEMYFHPATARCPEIDRTMPHYRHEAELAALTDPRVKETIGICGIDRIAFSDL